jgi:hypothetical protein
LRPFFCPSFCPSSLALSLLLSFFIPFQLPASIFHTCLSLFSHSPLFLLLFVSFPSPILRVAAKGVKGKKKALLLSANGAKGPVMKQTTLTSAFQTISSTITVPLILPLFYLPSFSPLPPPPPFPPPPPPSRPFFIFLLLLLLPLLFLLFLLLPPPRSPSYTSRPSTLVFTRVSLNTPLLVVSGAHSPGQRGEPRGEG